MHSNTTPEKRIRLVNMELKKLLDVNGPSPKAVSNVAHIVSMSRDDLVLTGFIEESLWTIVLEIRV